MNRVHYIVLFLSVDVWFWHVIVGEERMFSFAAIEGYILNWGYHVIT
jgi:hypothetical protein